MKKNDKKINYDKILVGIVTIDRDIDLAPQLYNSIIKNKCKNIMIVTRMNDHKSISYWENKSILKTVPHYEIKNRHNMDEIAKKRMIIVDYAKNRYNAIWFIDSDIIPLDDTLYELARTEKDICISPYKVKWTGYPCVGIKSDKYPFIKIHKISLFDKLISRKSCIIGGFGCTYMKSTTFNQKIEYKKLENEQQDVYGEDIGFFMNCYNNGLTCEYLTRWIQPHLFDRNK